MFDARFRSCRRSLARHQERRKHRHALQAARGRKGKQARQQQAAQQAAAGSSRHVLQDAQGSQPGHADSDLHAQLLQLLLPPPLVERPAQPEPAAVSTPQKPRRPSKQHQPRQAAGKPLGAHAEQAAAAAAPLRTETDGPSAEQPLLPEQCSSEVHSAQAPQPQQPAAEPPASSMPQARQSAVMQPVTPPGQPGSHAARSVPLAEVASPWAHAHAVQLPQPPRQALWPPPQQAPAAPAEAAWAQQPPAAPAAVAWGQQPLPAQPACPAWGQQQAPECGWMLVFGDQRRASAQQALPPQQAPQPAMACDVQQPAGQAIWLVHQVKQDPSAGGGCSGSSSATYYPIFEPAMAQTLLPVPAPIAPEPLTYSQAAETAACSASTAATPLSPRINGPNHSLQHCGSGVSTYLLATPLSPHTRMAAPARLPYHGTISTHGRPALWVADSAPAASSLPAAVLLPEGRAGGACGPNQAWGQPAWQSGEQAPPSAAATPRFAAQPSLPLNHGLSSQPSLTLSLQPSPCAAPQPSRLPSPHAALPPCPPAPPQAQLGCQQTEPWQQLQRWQADWAEDALVPSQHCCPQSPAVSWLNSF